MLHCNFEPEPEPTTRHSSLINAEIRLSVAMLSDFLDKLGDNWIKFLTIELKLLRDQLTNFATLDFLDTAEAILNGKLKG